MDGPDQLKTQIDRVNHLLSTQRTLPAKLEAIAEVLERTIPRCDAVSVALVLESASVTGAASSQLAVEADLVQYAHNQGPCLTSAQTRSVVRIDVLSQDERFEHFAPGAIEIGVESVVSVPLLHGATVVGSINLYSTEPHAFDDAALEHVRPIADYAADVISHSPLYAEALGLVEELVSYTGDRDVVAQAIGILRVREHADEAAAVALLQAEADRRGVSVPDAARAVVEASTAGGFRPAGEIDAELPGEGGPATG
ncbi:MAG TPA: GAF and ANTAR domain-containing protein [Aquihabitans sp.]|jgi:GAF domain-containing protein|nr:GAF and ANTAR domain-containing protein [Aquihabitans sp.]